MTLEFTLIHNPNCSKSLMALEILNQHNVQFYIHDYLNEPLSETEILNILDGLTEPIGNLVRTTDELYKKISADHQIDLLDRKSVSKLLADYPQLLQRPLLLFKDNTVIARPPEETINALLTTLGVTNE